MSMRRVEMPGTAVRGRACEAGRPRADLAALAFRAATLATVAMLSAAGALLGGCTLDLANRHAAQEMAQQARPPGSVQLGWRIYEQRCAGCHGRSADILGGVPGAPDLRDRLRDLGPRRFFDLVLRRYDGLAPGAPRATLLDELVAGRGEPITMPAWNGEPVVQAHLVDLYAYLGARAEGRLGPGRPPP
jgi:cytochrome c5